MKNTMRPLALALLAVWSGLGSLAAQEEETLIRVFVALCDNETQGIQKVNARIGNGNDPANNLYWGCSDGLKLYFKNSSKWKLTKAEQNPSETVLERLTFEHTSFAKVRLMADAYRGSAMKPCLEALFTAVTSPDEPAGFVAFIGHNGLMDHMMLMPPAQENTPRRDVAVLCCLSESYFRSRLVDRGHRPVLLTRQLMYPGAFLLHDALEGWLRQESPAQIRERAARAYAKNQGISAKAARGIFADLEVAP